MSEQYDIPYTGPFIYDFGNRSVRNVEIKTIMEGADQQGGPTQTPTVIQIEKTGNGPIEIKVLYGYGTKFEEEFGATISAATDTVNLSLLGDNLISIAWEASNNYPIREWHIPIADVLLITTNKAEITV